MAFEVTYFGNKGFDNLDPLMLFKLSTAPTKGHSLKLVKTIRHIYIRQCSSAHRVIDIWNRLDESMKDVIQLIVLKLD